MADTPILSLTRIFTASQEEVFRAWTNAGEIEKWFGPESFRTTVSELTVRVGGKYRFMMRGPGGEVSTVFGIFREVERPHKLVFSWRWADTDEPETLVTVVFRPKEGGTEITLTHSNFASDARKEQHAMGWSSSWNKLSQLRGR